MAVVLTPEVLARFKAEWLPADAETNGWDDDTITERWTGGVATTARKYWFERVQDTAGYLDLPDPGGTLPITQIYRQAREMLAYWDDFIVKYGDVDPDQIGINRGRTVKIKNRYPRPYPNPRPLGDNPRSPYTRT